MRKIKYILESVVVIIVLAFTSSAQTSNWQLHGPSNFPVNISGQINGIGRVCQIKFAPNSNKSMFACSASGGLWKSLDTGHTWFQLHTDALPKMGTSSVCVDFTDSNIIYLASGDPNYYGTDLGIWKTMNGGLNWTQINNGIGTKMALQILMDPANHLVLVAATNSGIYKTTDGGATWIETLAGNAFTDLAWQPLAGTSILYASSMNKFFRSTDKGDTWTEITAGFSSLLNSGTRLGVSDANPAIVYVATVNDEGTIFRSTDTGLNFTIQYHSPTVSLTGYDTTGGGQGNYNFCFEANPSNPDQVFLGSHNVWRSDDAGVTWTQMTKWWQKVHTDMHDWVFQPNNSSNLFQANDGGVWFTNTAGDTWSQRSDGLGATENYNAAVSPLYAQLVSTGTQDNGELVFIDNIWKTNRGGDWTSKMAMDYSPQKFVYYFDDKQRRPLPTGGGVDYALPAAVNSSTMKHVFSPDDQNLGYVSSNNIWQCKNLLGSVPVWTQIATSLSSVKSLAVCKTHPNIFAYSVSNQLYISHDALSASPTFQNFPFPISGTASDIAISSFDTNKIFVIINTKVYRSQDGGNTFTDYTGTLPAITHLNLFLDDYSNENNLYLGNTQGVFFRNNTMADWDNYSGILPTIAGIKNIMYFNDGGKDARLFVSYYGRGVWQTSLEPTHTCMPPSFTTSNWNGTNFQVNWSNTGASQYQLQYRELGTLDWTSQIVNSTGYTLNNYAGCAKYEARVKSNCTSDTSLWSDRLYFETPSNVLNADFDGHQDIGAVGATGSVCYDAIRSRYTVYGAGEDIWNKNDEFHYLYKKVHGDVTISARVRYIGNIYGWAKGGVMIRETLADDAKQAMCAMTPGNGFAMQWRENTNDWTSNKDTAGSAPAWVKMERLGTSFTSYFSVDGVNWDVLNTATISMTDTVYVGLANCSHIDSTINDAIFDQITINGKTLAVENIDNTNSPLTIYPNPTKNELMIELNSENSNDEIDITVYDLSSKKVMQQQIKPNGQSSIKLNVSQLQTGNYFIEILGKQRHVAQFTIK